MADAFVRLSLDLRETALILAATEAVIVGDRVKTTPAHRAELEDLRAKIRQAVRDGV